MNNAELQLHLSSNKVSEPITLNNGVTLSIQASEGHFCSPRSDAGPWISAELGLTRPDFEKSLPIFKQLGIERFCKDDSDFWVAGWISIQKILDFIKLSNEVEA